MCKSKFFPASLKFHTKASEEQEELFRRIMSFLPQSPMRSGVATINTTAVGVCLGCLATCFVDDYLSFLPFVCTAFVQQQYYSSSNM